MILKPELNHINNWVFDLDDTITPTRQHFRQQMNMVYDYFSQIMPNVPREQIKSIFEKLNNDAFKVEKVNPDRWGTVLKNFSCKFPRIGITERAVALGTLDLIYYVKPEFMSGAQETLETIKNSGKRQFIVTHSNETYAWRKYNRLELSRFVPRENVHVSDENSDKDKFAWESALDRFGLSPTEVAVVGNSSKDDIWPAYEIGVKHLFFVDDSKNEWIVHVKEPPEGTQRIKGIYELLQ